jgi:hypothetical protein
MSKRVLALCAVLTLAVGMPAAWAGPLYLTPPTGDYVARGAGGTRGDIVTTSANFALTSIGIEAQIDLNVSLTFNAYVWDSTGRTGGSALATGAPILLTGNGSMQFYDLPIAFTLLPGNEYDIGVDFNSFNNPALSVHYYFFAYPDSPFTVSPITVIDGEESHCGPCNVLTPNLRLNGSNNTVPDPGSSLLLMGMGLAGLTLWRRR